jgi:plasmid stability protein
VNRSCQAHKLYTMLGIPLDQPVGQHGVIQARNQHFLAPFHFTCDSMVIARRVRMGDLLIRDLPASTHEELKRRAELAGMSLQAYVAQLLKQSTATPSLDEWLRGLEDLPTHPEVSGTEVMRAVRDELP